MNFIAIRGILLLVFLISSLPCFAQDESLPYTGIIDINSNITPGGLYSLRSLVRLTQDKGIKILVLSDSFLRHWEYGLPLFSNIFKISKEEHSVVKYGIKRYLQDFKKIQDESPNTLILEGVEVAPFYWWSGSILKKNLTMNDWSRHLLVFGLKRHQDYMHLPVVCNRYFLPQLKDTLHLFIPGSLIILGIFILKKRKPKKFLGLTLNILGILFLFNFFPFSASRYNPYHGDKGFLPHQDLINYVHKKGGLVFWAHPEITESTSLGRFLTIDYYTPSYPGALISTSSYTGFGVNMLPGTSHNLILAGEEWDKVLISYCKGERGQPVWAIGEADYRGGGRIDATQNIFLLPQLNPKSVFGALRNGKLYIRYYSEDNVDISLSNFHIEDSQDKDNAAFIADEIKIKGKPKIYIKGNYIINPPEDLTIEIIRDGEVIKRFEFSNENEFDIEFQDGSLEVYNRKSYYRLIFFAGNKIILVTNPIFIEIKNG